MATLESWLEIPPYATPLHETEQGTVAAVVPPAQEVAVGQSPSSKRTSNTSMNLTQAVLTSALSVSSSPAPSSPRKTAGKLLSTRDQLSIPITAVNFRRFVSRSGSVFWLQDRIEEIVMWRKGWRVTGAWMGAYAFLCKIRAQKLHNAKIKLNLCYRFLPKTCPSNSADCPIVHSLHHVQREVSCRCPRGRRTTTTLEAHRTQGGFC